MGLDPVVNVSGSRFVTLETNPNRHLSSGIGERLQGDPDPGSVCKLRLYMCRQTVGFVFGQCQAQIAHCCDGGTMHHRDRKVDFVLQRTHHINRAGDSAGSPHHERHAA